MINSQPLTVIRNATIMDASIIHAFICKLEDMDFEYKVFEKLFNHNLTNNNCFYLVAEINGEAVGFASLHVQQLLHHNGKVGEIQEFYVQPSYRGNGIGKLLVNTIKKYAITEQVQSIEVTTNKSRAYNLTIYEKLGFTFTHYKLTIDTKEMNTEYFVTTVRLLIKPLSFTDNDFIYRLVNTEGWIRFIGNRNVNSADEAIDYIKKIKEAEHIKYWVVRIEESKQPVGIVTLIQRDYLEHPDLGFAFLPEYSNNGYAYEAAKGVLNKLTEEDKERPILATTLPENFKSVNLLNKLGFVFEKEIEVDTQTLQLYKLHRSNKV